MQWDLTPLHIDAILSKDARDMKDIIRITGAIKNGKCCGSVIQEIISKTLN